ncbi:MAG: hypothetical protein ABIK47_03405 [candidate division WOR-3 bacterium]
MAKVVKRSRVKPQAVVKALESGAVMMPLFGGCAVLGLNPKEIRERLGGAYRLVPPDALGLSGEIRQVLQKEAVAVLKDGEGLALGWEPFTEAMLKKVGADLWFGLPGAGEEPEELMNDFGDWLKLVVIDKEWGLGPTVIDFSGETPTVLRKGRLGILGLEAILRKRVRLGPGLYFSVLVVCTGNSCRSPIAAGLLVQELKGLPVVITSAGVAAPVGRQATGNAINVAMEMDIDISGHRARQLNKEMIDTADLILVMEPGQRSWIVNLLPEADVKVRLLGGYPEKEVEIPDPIGRSVEFYRQTALLIKAGVLKVTAELRERFK